MNLPELGTKEQYQDYLAAVETVSKFGDFIVRVRSLVSRDELRTARHSLERHWGYTTARQKERILVAYVKIRMG